MLPGMPQDSDVAQILQLFSLERLPIALGILLIGWMGMTVTSRFLDDMGERLTDRRLTLKKVKALIRFALYLLVGITAPLSMVDSENSGGLFSLLALLSVGIGFALKDIVSSLMSGVLLLLDEPFQVGDRIAFDGYYGEVTEIGLRSVRLVTLDDNLVTIPNSKFLVQAVASANAGALDCMVVVPFYVGIDQDYILARRILTEVAATSKYVYLDKPVTTVMADELVGVRFCTVIRVKAYVFDARYEKAFVTDMTMRAKTALRDAGVASPEETGAPLQLSV